MPDVDADLKVCRIASLTLTNAMIFQQVLAERDTRVQSLSRAIRSRSVAESLLETWTFILEKIDYIPIFTTANEVVKDLVGVPDADDALKRLGDAALRITSKRAAPVAADERSTDKILCMWFNSTLGLMSILAARVDTRGAWIDLKKPTLEDMLVINPRKLSEDASKSLCAVYDEVAKQEIQALPQMADDDIRSKIDAAVAKVLNIKDDLSVLRKLLAAEPVISMKLP